MSYVPLFPLAFLLFSGLYLFVLPYATTWRTGTTRQLNAPKPCKEENAS